VIVDHDGVFRQRRTQEGAELLGRDRAGWPRRPLQAGHRRGGVARAQGFDERVQGVDGIVLGAGELVDARARSVERARLVRIGEEGYRRLRAHQDQVPHVLQHGDRLVDGVGDSLHRDPTRAASDARGEGGRKEPRPGRRRNLAGEVQGRLASRAAPQYQGGAFAGPQNLRSGRNRCIVRAGGVDAGARRDRRVRPFLRNLVPGGIRGQDEAGHPAGRAQGRRHRRGAVGRERVGAGRGAYPMAEGPRRPLDVGGQGRIEMPVMGGVIADDVDDRRLRPHGVVQVRQAVGEAWPEVEQRRGRPIQHARIAVGGAGGHAFEQREDAAHALHPVERRHEVHLRGAGIGEADLDMVLPQGLEQAFGAVHGFNRNVRQQRQRSWS
jgi:hypothetical protein